MVDILTHGHVVPFFWCGVLIAWKYHIGVEVSQWSENLRDVSPGSKCGIVGSEVDVSSRCSTSPTRVHRFSKQKTITVVQRYSRQGGNREPPPKITTFRTVVGRKLRNILTQAFFDLK